MEKTKLGLSQNVEAVIAYSLPPIAFITGLVMLFLETENKFVRFNAMQSFILFGFYALVGLVFGFIPFIGGILLKILGSIILISWIFLILNAFKGKYFKFPIIGEAIYEKIVG